MAYLRFFVVLVTVMIFSLINESFQQGRGFSGRWDFVGKKGCDKIKNPSADDTLYKDVESCLYFCENKGTDLHIYAEYTPDGKGCACHSERSCTLGDDDKRKLYKWKQTTDKKDDKSAGKGDDFAKRWDYLGLLKCDDERQPSADNEKYSGLAACLDFCEREGDKSQVYAEYDPEVHGCACHSTETCSKEPSGQSELYKWKNVETAAAADDDT